MTDDITISPCSDLALASRMARNATAMARGAIELADRSVAIAILDRITDTPDPIRFSDMLVGLGAALAVHAKTASSEIGCSYNEAIAIVAAAVSIIAQQVAPKDLN